MVITRLKVIQQVLRALGILVNIQLNLFPGWVFHPGNVQKITEVIYEKNFNYYMYNFMLSINIMSD